MPDQVSVAMGKVLLFLVDRLGIIAFTVILAFGLAYEKSSRMLKQGHRFSFAYFIITFLIAVAVGTVAGHFASQSSFKNLFGLPWDYIISAVFTLMSAGLFAVGIDAGDYVERNSETILKDIHARLKKKMLGDDEDGDQPL